MMQVDALRLFEAIPAESWLILAVALAAFLGFYVLDFRRWGALSFASYFFGFNYLLKIVVMYPFAWSAHNIVATNRHFEAILAHLDTALQLTAAGFVFMVCGILAARLTDRRPPLGCAVIHAVIARGWNTGGGVAAGIALLAGLSALALILGFRPFVARDLVFEQTALRPVYNLWSQIAPFVAINTILFGVVRRRYALSALGVGLALLGIAAGNRTVAVLTLMQVAVMILMPRRFRNLPLLLIGAAGLASLALAIAALRGDHLTTSDQLGILNNLLYGNDLSDLRDFAWILTGLDQSEFYWGKTYLAGYLSFIPSFLLPFREQYGIGRVTPLLAGLDPAFHSGLRPPIFGEMYVNFGLPGLCIGGFLYGVLVGRILHWITRTLDQPESPSRPAPELVVWSGFLMLQVVDSLVFTSAFFGVYVLIGLLIAGRILARMGERRV
jgi:oligosaccharide repeat unit polymerase